MEQFILTLWERAGPPAALILAACALGYWFTGKHLNRRDSVPLQEFLERGGWEPAYRRGLTTVLDWLARRLTPPEWHDRLEAEEGAPAQAARAWNWLAYDRMLLLAVAYPILLPLLFWLGAGSPATLGGVEVVPAPESGFDRGLVGGGLLGMVLLLWFRERLAQAVHRHLVFPLIGSFSRGILRRAAPLGLGLDLVRGALFLAAVVSALALAGASLFAFAAAGALAVALVGAVAGAGLVALALAGAIAGVSLVALALALKLAGANALALADAGSVAVAFAGAVAVAVAGAGASAFAFAGAGALAVAMLLERRWRPATVLGVFTALLGCALALATAFTPDRPAEASVLLLFLVALPLINAVFDFLSLGLTRWCLRNAVEEREVRLLGLRLRGWWAFNLIDVAGALLALAGLILAMLLAVAGLNALTPENPLMDLGVLFAELRDDGADMRWLYVMVFSTLLPSVLHLGLFLLSLLVCYPGVRPREWLVRLIATAGKDDDRRALVQLAMGVWVALWVAVPVGLWIWLLPNVDLWHSGAMLWLIDRVEGIALALRLV